MSLDLMAIARRHLPRTVAPNERNERNEESPPTAVTSADLSSYTSFLSSPPPFTSPGWGRHLAEVRRLLVSADNLVASLSVDGAHPGISAAAAMVASAVLTGDIETVRFAVSQSLVVVKQTAAAQHHSRQPTGENDGDDG